MDIRHALFWGSAAVIVVAELLILRAAFFPTADATPSAQVPRSPRAMEILWGILPAIALAGLLWTVWRLLA
jgi:hypothetical protein